MCAIFGLIDYNHTLNAKQREKLLSVLSEECEERGTDATGYAFNHNGKLTDIQASIRCSQSTSAVARRFKCHNGTHQNGDPGK